MPVVAAIIGAAVSAAELGMNLAGVGQPSQGAEQKKLQQQQQQQAQQDALAKQRAIQAALPNAQEQGGGALNQPSLLNLGSVIAGLPGETHTPAGQNALQAFLGTTANAPNQNETMMGATYGTNLSGSQG